MKRRTILLLFFFFDLLILTSIAPCQSLDWIFKCDDNNRPDYYKDIDNLTKNGITVDIINARLREKLQNQPLGQNYECLYDVILRYGDNTVVNIFKKRMQDNSQVVKINNHYFLSLKQEGIVPENIISKVKKLKGKIFNNYENYSNQLCKILTDDEQALYKYPILWAGKLDPENYSTDIYKLLITRNIKYCNENIFIEQICELKHAVSYEYFLDYHLKELDVSKQLKVILYLLKNKFSRHATFGYHAEHILANIYQKHKNEYLSFINSKKELPMIFFCVINKTCP